MTISFTVFGEPVAQGRPRTAVIGGHARVYDPEKSRNYKTLVKLVAQEAKPRDLLEGPVILTLRIYRQIPKSFSKTARAKAHAGELRPTTKPDVSNVLKSIEDALNGVVWVDDRQIVGLVVSKAYDDNPRVEVEIREIKEAKAG